MDTLAWLDANPKRVGIIAAIVLVLAAIVIAVIYNQGQKEVRASLALSDIRAGQNPMQPPPPGMADKYLKVANDHAGTKAASRALLQAAATLFTEAKYSEAQQLFDRFLKQYPESPFVAQAHFGIASSLDAQGKTTEAAAKYEEIRRRFGTDPLMDEVKLAQARILENQGKPAEAHKIYDELVKANPYSGIGSEAGMRLEDLVKKHPELAKTNVPPPAMTGTNLLQAATNRMFTLTNLAQATNRGTNVPATNRTIIITNRPGGVPGTVTPTPGAPNATPKPGAATPAPTTPTATPTPAGGAPSPTTPPKQ